MHIVILAWLYVTFTMALAFASGAAGALFFVTAGLGPVALYTWLAVRRRRAARERAAERAPPPRVPDGG